MDVRLDLPEIPPVRAWSDLRHSNSRELVSGTPILSLIDLFLLNPSSFGCFRSRNGKTSLDAIGSAIFVHICLLGTHLRLVHGCRYRPTMGHSFSRSASMWTVLSGIDSSWIGARLVEEGSPTRVGRPLTGAASCSPEKGRTLTLITPKLVLNGSFSCGAGSGPLTTTPRLAGNLIHHLGVRVSMAGNDECS
ncbi:hypothetical protein VNO77_27707 [Canavalia gladiata]|uniref:Uncharacterized protein n=1 Tax=Canavalia gladiata TaxID=3824 RepID=A0AAN9KVS3_CANGL